jgi:CubicO group peptidase (beta-lactamase class C family)
VVNTATPVTVKATLTPKATVTKKAPQPDNHAVEVDALFSFVAEGEPGAAVIVIKEGEILYQQGYGLADRKHRTPTTPQTAFHLASAGKQFTAMAIMMFYEEGKLDYDDPIGAHLPELTGLGEEVTLRRMLHHTSGIPGWEGGETDIYEALQEQVSEPTSQDLVTYLSDWSEEELAYTPGDQYDYSNPGYDLLGALIERLSGQSFGDFMEEHIFSPLEMESTFSLPNPEKFALPNRARGYVAEDGTFTVYDTDPLDNLVGSGSIYSTVEDLYRYDQALYTNDLVSQETLAEAFQPAYLNDETEYPYGFAWELSEDESMIYQGHSGAWEGYLSYILRIPEEHLSVVVLSNRTDSDPESLAFEIADLYR